MLSIVNYQFKFLNQNYLISYKFAMNSILDSKLNFYVAGMMDFW